MATQKFTQAPPQAEQPVSAMHEQDCSEPEMKIVLRPFGHDTAEFFGTRSQLEAEGVIPRDIKWPMGRTKAEWKDERFEYSLRRVRPEGSKSPMKLWANGDWWYLRWDPRTPSDYEARELSKKRAELAAAMYWQSPEGRARRHVEFSRLMKARYDGAFQAFMAPLLPERKKPGRPAKPRVDADSAGD